MPELREDYIKAYKPYFMHTGDHQIAKELGLLELRRSWAETSADGSGRLTKHAPELEYPSLSAEVIKQRFETDLKAQGFDPETTFLKTDDQTRTESKTMHPTYALTVNGKALTLPDGAALRWKPNEGLFQIQIAANEDEENGDGGREKGNEANADDRKPQESNKGDHADECRSLEVDGYTINQKINKVSPEVNRRYSKLEGLRRDLVSEYRKYDENLAETLLKSIPRKIPKPNLPSAMLTLFRTAWNLASKLQERDKIDAKLNELEALKNQLVPEYESYLKKETELKWELRANTQKRERLNCG